jgi:hypothetical protein
MTALLLFLLACAPATWTECYHPLEAWSGIEPQGQPLEVTWCDGEWCFPVGWTSDGERLYVYEVMRLQDSRPVACVVWAEDVD